MSKTRLEDLSVINNRLQGLTEKKPETQETGLVKRIKLRVRSIKGCLLVLDAGIYSYQGVFKERCKTQKTDLGIMAFLRGLYVKPPLHPYLWTLIGGGQGGLAGGIGALRRP
jgi:hypothetical protein